MKKVLLYKLMHLITITNTNIVLNKIGSGNQENEMIELIAVL